MNFETLLLVLQTVWEEKIFVDWSGKGKPWARLNTSRPCQLDTLWSLYNLLQTLFDLDSDRFGRGKLNALPLQKKWSRFKGFYTQVWGSNPMRHNFYTKRFEFQFPENANYAENWRKYLQEIFSIAQGVPSRMDLIGRLRVM
ncbi:hypothetical protein YC2023_078850 [Brassica napus]